MYRAEFFDYKMVYKDFCVFDENTELSLDYLAWDASQIRVYRKAVKTIKSDLVHITRDGKTIFDGVVSAISYPAKSVMQIDIKPLLCFIHYVDGYDQHLQGCNDLAWAIYSSIFYRYAWGEESFMDAQTGHTAADNGWIIPIQGSDCSNSADRPYAYSDKFTVVSGLRMITDGLTMYRILTDASLDMKSRSVNLSVSINTAAVTIESDLDNIIDRSITLGDSYGSVNKYVVFNADDPEGSALSFFLHPDGTVDMADSNRILPIVEAGTSVSNSDTWRAEALQQAKDAMIPKAYNNEIDLTVRDNDAIIRPEEMQIGTLATIYAGGTAYPSLLTGKIRKNHLITLIFGSVRVDLTKQLLMERRK